MRNKWIKRFFPLLALILLAPWPVAYAHTYDADTASKDGVRVALAEESVKPTWTALGKAIGSVTPGDLFYIDATDNPADIIVTLYITNADELIGCYRNLILKVGVYTESDGKWEKASTGDGELVADTFITLINGQVSFTLFGLAKHKITIDGGNFYCATTNTDSGSLSPLFYLEVN